MSGRIKRNGFEPKNDELAFLNATDGIRISQPWSRLLQRNSPRFRSSSLRSEVTGTRLAQHQFAQVLRPSSAWRPIRSIRKARTASAAVRASCRSSGNRRRISSVILRYSPTGLGASSTGRWARKGSMNAGNAVDLLDPTTGVFVHAVAGGGPIRLHRADIGLGYQALNRPKAAPHAGRLKTQPTGLFSADRCSDR